MTISAKVTVLAVVFGLTAEISTAANVQIRQPGSQITQGWVLSVQRGNGQGTFQIRAVQPNNNVGAAANLVGFAAGLRSVQKFTVGPGTQFDAVRGMNRVPASFASLRPGQRISVQAQGQQALGVRIFPRNQHTGVRRARYVGSRRPTGLSGGRRMTMKFATTRNTVHTGLPKAAAASHKVRTAQVTRSAAHVKSKKH